MNGGRRAPAPTKSQGITGDLLFSTPDDRERAVGRQLEYIDPLRRQRHLFSRRSPYVLAGAEGGSDCSNLLYIPIVPTNAQHRRELSGPVEMMLNGQRLLSD